MTKAKTNFKGSPANKPQAKPSKPISKKLFERIEEWMNVRSTSIFLTASILCLLFSLLLFNVRISEGGDDSTYIQVGYNYSKNFFGYFFTFNAPLYPMFLALPVSIFGVKLILLKFLSVIFHFLHFFFLYKTFHKRIDNFILFPVLFFIALNSYFQYFASQTYNEAFFLTIQAVYFFTFIKLQNVLDLNENNLSKTYRQWLWFGFVGLLLTISKNVAIAIVPAFVLYFLFQRKWLNAIYAVLSYGLFRVAFESLKKLIWGNLDQYGSQGNILLQKDPYDVSKGMEDTMGFLHRFYDNVGLYISKRLFQIMGMLDENSTVVKNELWLFVGILLLLGFIRILISKNRLLLFIALYTVCVLGATFLVLQQRWDQPRMILIHTPIILMVILFGIYDLLRKSPSILQILYVFFLIGIMLPSLTSTLKKTTKNIPILSKNIKGDIYYGYTPDWTNYLKLSEWVGENLSDTSMVACRKASMSFMAANGKPFHGVATVFSNDADTVLAQLQKSKVTHVLFANLRRNPSKVDGYIINTVERLMKPVMDKYPQKLVFVKQEGTAEPAYLYEIKY